jgi:Leucine-rich repeat (LRR) protein
VGFQILLARFESRNLKYLNMSSTGLPGGNLSRLHYLDLSHNFLRVNGNIQWLSQLVSLRHLHDVKEWIQPLGKLPSLEVLGLAGNDLTHIPKSFPSVNLTSHKILKLSWQDFNSTIPDWIGSLHYLTHLNLENSHFVGPYPDALGNLTSLRELVLDSNPLHAKLNTLCLSDTRIDDVLPDWLWNFTSLYYLDLSSNKIEGNLSGSLKNMASLQYMYINDNEIEGNFSSSFPDTLYEIDASNNIQHISTIARCV